MPNYGGYIGFSRVPSGLSAPGVWALRDAERAKRDKRWVGDDIYYANTLALYRISDAASATFIDESAAAGTVVVGANVSKSTAQSKSGGVSALCNGTAGTGLTQVVSDGRFLMNSTDWTVECWMYPLTVHNGHIFITSNNIFTLAGFQVYLTNTSTITVNNAATAAFNGGTYATNSWQHLAVTRSSTTIRIFLNGSQIGTTTQTPVANGNGFRAGGSAANFGNLGFNGYIDDVRFTRSVARYTSNFTPPGAL